MTTQTSMEIAQAALANARNGQSVANELIVIEGFMERGIPEADIQPRENCLTFWAWKALRRSVKKGEHGVKVQTWVPIPEKTDESTGEVVRQAYKRPKVVTIFHESQTKALDA